MNKRLYLKSLWKLVNLELDLKVLIDLIPELTYPTFNLATLNVDKL